MEYLSHITGAILTDVTSVILHYGNVKISVYTLLWCNVTPVISVKITPIMPVKYSVNFFYSVW